MASTKMSHARRVLNKVDKILSHPNKWCKGTENNDHGRVCLLGALRIADNQAFNMNYEADSDVVWNLRNVFDSLVDENDFVEYNDAKNTTFKDIKKLIQKAKKVVK